MKPRASYFTSRQYPKDEPAARAEMFNLGPAERGSHDSHYEAKNDPEPTFREKWSNFPWKTFLVISTSPLALAPIIVLSAAAEAALQNYIGGREYYTIGC
ncbi:hypothetical protein P153DRAFT_388263 [Dothidotthia symphoricarpi CBS 119687]|uniref:Uncharacterized protein n=1 Tax=Dothidotthia symphoricarpi CBS 119687 TaxID=1392245 RepID=A0A6A6A6W7_9PLEO|nr:uncharacterized protein P153DRAFT_388263 [Dothidotthia symphoricarpi CBS 119687]KAF2126945.1 hypothetical protein P153DRAFT_388263 [Dothidotthia symphoricarpi CBS 119687]